MKNITKTLIIGMIFLSAVDAMAWRPSRRFFIFGPHIRPSEEPAPSPTSEKIAQEKKAKQIAALKKEIEEALDQIAKNNAAISEKRKAWDEAIYGNGILVNESSKRSELGAIGDDEGRLSAFKLSLDSSIKTQRDWIEGVWKAEEAADRAQKESASAAAKASQLAHEQEEREAALSASIEKAAAISPTDADNAGPARSNVTSPVLSPAGPLSPADLGVENEQRETPAEFRERMMARMRSAGLTDHDSKD